MIGYVTSSRSVCAVRRLAVVAVLIHVLEIPAQDHDPCAEGVELTHQGEKVAVGGDQDDHVVAL